MKRLFHLFLVMCTLLCGCGSTVSETEPPETTPATESVAPVVLTPTSAAAESVSASPGNVTISETVVFDNGDFKLTAKEIDFSDDYDVRVKFLAENNTANTVSIVGSDFSINGITMYCNFYIELAPGKKANDFLEISRDDLDYVGIENIATIQAQDTYIYNKDTSKKILDFQFSLETSISEGYQQEIDSNGQTVYDQNGILIKYRGIVPGSFGGEELEFYVENNSDSNIGVYVDDVSVNGFMVYGSMVAHAYPHCVTYETLDFSTSDLEENDIDSIDEISVSFYGYDESINKKIWTTDEIVIGRSPSASEVTPGESSASSSLTIEDLADVAKNVLENQYDDVTVVCDGNTIVIDLTYPGLSSAVQDIISVRSEALLDAWDEVITSLKNVCEAILTNAKNSDIEDVSVLMNVNNDQNPENALLIIFNDTVIYDVINSK